VPPPEGGFLDYSQNVNPLGPPEGSVAAAERALREEAGRYPDGDYPALRAALARYLGVRAGTVLPTNGGAEALFLAARVAADLAPAGSRGAIVLEPTFSEYAAAARAAGFEPVRPVSRHPETTGFRLSEDALADLDGIGLVFLCNPNNPTGDLLGRSDVLRVSESVLGSGAVLVVDEAFIDFVPDASVAEAVGEAGERLLVARSFTKFFAMPGLRLGCLVSGSTERARAYQPSWPVNAVAAAAGLHAAGDAAFAERTVAEVSRLRAGLERSLGRLPGLTVYPGTANFLLLRGPLGLVEALARRGILVRGCAPFPGLGPEYLRVAVRSEAENVRLVGDIVVALEALGEAGGVGP
jgi:threonine-phosphate decarboxylase